MAEPQLVYHTFYKEFSGSTAEEVIQRLYEDSKEGTGCSFPEWWDYQKKLWGQKYDHAIPETPDAENAHQKLLDFLVEVGALEVGPKEPPQRTVESGRGR